MGIYREDLLKRLSEPDRLDQYLRVTKTGKLMGILVAALIAAGIISWIVFCASNDYPVIGYLIQLLQEG